MRVKDRLALYNPSNIDTLSTAKTIFDGPSIISSLWLAFAAPFKN